MNRPSHLAPATAVLGAVSAIPVSYVILWLDGRGSLDTSPWVGESAWFGLGLFWFLCFALALRWRGRGTRTAGRARRSARRPVRGAAERFP